MNKTNAFKKWMITGLTLAMVLGGSSAAFAHGDDHGDKGQDNKGDHGSKASHINMNAKGNVQVGDGNTQFIINFGDVKGADVEWAVKNIASLASKHVFEGYEDGTFRPRQSISHIEAITAAVRLMGLKDKALAEMNTQLNFKDADKIPSWAVGYVAVAVENDLFLETDTSVQPEKAASRLWATTLLIKALKLDTEAQTKMNTHLTFKDANKIPAGSVGYIEEAIEKGLITGFEDNTFRPNEPVTRAQLAALLDRTNDQMTGNGAVKGTVTSVVYDNSISLSNNGATTVYPLDPNAFIYRDGVKVTATSLQVGDMVNVHLYNGIAIFVEVKQNAAPVTTPPPVTPSAFTISGLFDHFGYNAQNQIDRITMTQNGGTQASIYNVAPGVVIQGDLNLLVANHPITIKGNSSNLVTTIVIN